MNQKQRSTYCYSVVVLRFLTDIEIATLPKIASRLKSRILLTPPCNFWVCFFIKTLVYIDIRHKNVKPEAK